MKTRLHILTLLMCALAILWGCHHDHEAEEHHHHHEAEEHHHHHHHEGEEHHHDHHHEPGTIVMDAAQSKALGIAVDTAKLAPFWHVVKATAQVLPSPQDEMQVAASLSGMVLLADGIVEGSAVASGQTLMTIESGKMADGNMAVRYREATVRYERAKAEYERKSALAKDQIVSRSELELSTSEYEAAKAEYDNLKSLFSAAGSRITAPIGGYITALYTRNGSYATSGETLLTIARGGDLHLRCEVPARHYRELAGGISSVVIVDNGETIEVPARIAALGHAVSTDNPLLPVTLRVGRSAIGSRLLQGSYVTTYLRTVQKEAITVANEGIIEEMGQAFVFVQTEPEHYLKRPVTLGATDGVSTEIVKGINQGERIVSRGATMLRLSQSSTPLDPHAGHVH
ncbi:MAG: efflux RND transporter periplasmic adaptor subunit [Bacteroidales bacterium]|nr:efflux RND transporter periplasmic adaptor subunit [Bacteroidales bacterium]